ncbi:MAG: IclR family transcriptional regulator [Chloroflexia bacterium]|nr:IclR family transcriptional regulator [Chloroflexia bacterium]
MPERTLSTVRNAVRALDVLAERGPLRLTALAKEMALGKSTVHLLLQTLRENGMVEHDPVSSTYRVGLRVFEIGATAVEQGGFGVRLIGAMEELARRCNESVSLGVLSAGSVLFVQRVESPEVLRADIRPGTRMPLHASASGKALLATMSEIEIARLLPHTVLPGSARLTLRQRDALLSELRLVRERGYARQSEEFVDGIAALAAPVLTVGGRLLGALSIAGPIARFDETAWARDLLPAAREMSQMCGCRAGRGTFGANGDRPSPAGIGAGPHRARKED